MLIFFFFKQKTAYEMRISDWSADVCSSDLVDFAARVTQIRDHGRLGAQRILERADRIAPALLGIGDERLVAGAGKRSRRIALVERPVDVADIVGDLLRLEDRKRTRLNSSH